MTDPETGEEIVFDLGNLKEAKISWLTRILLRFFPEYGILRLAEELGCPTPRDTRLIHRAFKKVERVDIIPAQAGERGFQLVLDKDTSLFFHQDGDHFTYDGYELGEYDKGEVTVFDHLRRI